MQKIIVSNSAKLEMLASLDEIPLPLTDKDKRDLVTYEVKLIESRVSRDIFMTKMAFKWVQVINMVIGRTQYEH